MGSRRTRRAAAVATAVGAALVLASCGSSGGGSKAGSSSTTRRTTTTTTSTTTTSVPPSSTTAPCSFSGITTTSQQTAAVSDRFTLRSVKVTPGACSDTVRFGFSSANPAVPPPYEISLVSPPFAQSGSGAPISLPGRTFLKVKFSPAWTYDLDTGADLYPGPDRIDPAGGTVTRALVLSDAYEGVVTWIIGIDGSGRYRVTSTASPPSVTVTIGP